MSGAVESAEGLRRFCPPAETRNSGVPWLGDLPAHWLVKPVKFLASADNSGVWGDEPDECELPLPVATTAHIDPDGSLLVDEMPRRCLSVSDARYYQCRVGDIVVVKSSGSATNVISGKAGLVGKDEAGMVFSNFLLRLRPFSESVDPRILFRFLTSSIVKERIRVMVSTTTYPNLRVGEYLRFEVPLAPRPEQQVIANFLDRETEKIDALIAKKERLIELLKEKRIALITHAVTKGLDPDVEMKDSGVDWLGEVPKHWEVRKTTHLFEIGSGTTPKSDNQSYYDGDIPWVTTSELRENVVLRTNKNVSRLALADYASLKLHPDGSLVIAMYGATIGRLGILGVGATVNQACCVFTPNALITTDFAFYWFEMGRQHLISLGTGGGQPNLSQDLLRAIRIPIPHVEEQAQIATALSARLGKLGELATRIRQGVDRLKEFRTALISAAVTGKIDVRQEVG